MSLINVLNVIPKNPITKFNNPYSFQIIIDIKAELKKEIEWKMIYITSDNQNNDQILSQYQISPPKQLGVMKFEFKGDAPSIEKIPDNDLLGSAAIVLCSSYNNKEYFRCGYFLNVYFEDEEMNIYLPEIIDANHLVRNLLADKPKIIIYDINWEEENEKNDNNNELSGECMSDENNNNNANEEKIKIFEK
jgi:histone chaperone ASF1